MFKFLHAADIHLDSPFLGLERYEGAPVVQMRQATRHAFSNLVQLALDEKVAFVLIAGDLYDRDWRDYRTGLFFVNQIARLKQANIRTFVIAGNHDAFNKMTKTLRLQAGVMLKTDEPETCIIEDLRVAVHGQGFAEEKVTDDLSARFPRKWDGYFNIGLLHTCANGDPRGKYAPCTIDGLLTKGYDYWALGHQHRYEELHKEPYIVFSGNTQGRHVGETETGPKGCVLVTVHDNRRVELEFRRTDVVRWERCQVNAEGAKDPDAVLDLVTEQLSRLRKENEGRRLAVRVEINGSCPAHELLQADTERWTNNIRSNGAGADDLWIEKVKFDTTSHRSHAAISADGPIGELPGVFEKLRADDAIIQSLREELADLARKLPQELKDGPEGLRLDDPAWLRGIFAKAEPLLVNKLRSGQASQ
jgi:DNA repair exonuclease SbcCD nuclease subunit